MKQIERVSIGGYAFSLEKEAAQAVAAYLKDMTAYYPNPEIVEGIEERMAELLLERTPSDGVVTLSSVQEIMDILGRPEKIEEEEPERSTPEEKPKKKLYRDMENARVAGVCAGLAQYFDVDITLVRVLMLVALVAGSAGFWIYVILWIVVPKALTPAQQCEMRGISPTAENLSKFTLKNKK